jgi:DNA replication protein DnaC
LRDALGSGPWRAAAGFGLPGAFEPGLPRHAPDACAGCPCPSCHGAGFVRRDAAPWERDAFGQVVACRCTQERRRDAALEQVRRLSNVQAIAHLTFDAFDAAEPDAAPGYAAARTFAANPEGWLVLYGNVGTGKTHLAGAVANELVGRGVPVVFQVVPTLLDHLRATFGPKSEVDHDELFASVKDAGVLVLDDLGTERATDWAREKLFQLVDHRWLRRLPLVVTTNRKREQFRDENGKRLASRLFDRGLAQTVCFTGEDYRQRPLRARLRVVGGTEAAE